MVGINVLYRCPICNKTIHANLGSTSYYNYEDKTVIIAKCCGQPFIAKYCLEPNIFSKYNIPEYKSYIIDIVGLALSKFYNPKLNEDEMIDKIIEFITTSEECAKYRENIKKDINDVKVISQISLANKVFEETLPLFSLPLTDEVKSKLVFSHNICW